jgi:hypothetical protein
MPIITPFMTGPADCSKDDPFRSLSPGGPAPKLVGDHPADPTRSLVRRLGSRGDVSAAPQGRQR